MAQNCRAGLFFDKKRVTTAALYDIIGIAFAKGIDIMNLLFLGDVVGSHGCSFVASKINEIKREYNIDIVVINGENSADGNGITPQSAKSLFNLGADVITTGNHCFRRREIMPLYDEKNCLIRPANFPEGNAGKGVCVYDMGSAKIAVINLMGTLYLEAIDNPFSVIDRLLEEIDTPNIFIDFHAEATSEKKSMGQYLAGRVTAVLGTHTHVQTADEVILSDHTAYITDAGMCGAELSVLGVKSELAIKKQRFHCPVRFVESNNPAFINGVVVAFDEKCGKAYNIKRLLIR